MRDRIVPWFRAASRMQVMFLSASTPWTRARQQQALDEPVVVLEPLQPARRSRRSSSARSRSTSRSISCCCSSIGQQLVLVELLGVLEVHPHHVGERLVAVGHHVPQVAQRDHVPQPQGVPPVDQQLEHDLQGGPLPLQGTRDRHQGLDQRRAERVDQLEHRPVGFPGQQDLHDLLPHLGGLLEGVLQLGPAGVVLGLQHPLLGDHRQVAVLQGDRVEPALPVRQHVGEVQLLDAR